MSKKILIAEDDDAILDVLKSILEGEGYLTLSARTEGRIYDLIEHESPQLLLLDIWLSGQDGAKIAKELKANSDTKTLPIVMMSANNETEKITQKVGADGFLLKPFTIDELLAVVKNYTK